MVISLFHLPPYWNLRIFVNLISRYKQWKFFKKIRKNRTSSKPFLNTTGIIKSLFYAKFLSFLKVFIKRTYDLTWTSCSDRIGWYFSHYHTAISNNTVIPNIASSKYSHILSEPHIITNHYST